MYDTYGEKWLETYESIINFTCYDYGELISNFKHSKQQLIVYLFLVIFFTIIFGFLILFCLKCQVINNDNQSIFTGEGGVSATWTFIFSPLLLVLFNNSLNLLFKSLKCLTNLDTFDFIIHFSYTSGVFLTCFKMDEIINWNWLKVFLPFIIHYGLKGLKIIYLIFVYPVEKSLILEDSSAIMLDYLMKVCTRFSFIMVFFESSLDFFFFFTLADKLNNITNDTNWYTVTLPLWIKHGNCYFL